MPETPNETPPQSETPPKVVAYENFQAVVSAKAGLEAQVASLKGEVQKLSERAAAVDTLSTQVNEWKGKYESAQSRFSTFTELSGALGTTETDVIDIFDARYRALPEEARPARKAWVDSLRAAPDTAPPILRPWLVPPQQPGRPNILQPRVPGTTGIPPGAPSALTEADMKRMTDHGQATGDWSEWREARKRWTHGK